MSKLLRVKEILKDHGQLSLDEFAAILPYIHGSGDQQLTREQLSQLRDRHEAASPDSDLAEGWLTFVTKLRKCYEEGLTKTDPEAKECIKYWQELSDRLIGDNPQLKQSVWSFHAAKNAPNYGLTDELFKYLNELIGGEIVEN